MKTAPFHSIWNGAVSTFRRKWPLLMLRFTDINLTRSVSENRFQRLLNLSNYKLTWGFPTSEGIWEV